MRRVLLSIAVALPLAILPAGGAGAQGNSGIDQYTENVPGAGGDQPTGGGSTTGGDPEESVVSPTVADEFEDAGVDGAAAAQLAQATSPSGGQDPSEASSGGDPDNSSGSDGSTESSRDGIGSTVGNLVAGASGDSDGMGIALPIILGLTLVGAVAFLLARRRGSGAPGGV